MNNNGIYKETYEQDLDWKDYDRSYDTLMFESLEILKPYNELTLEEIMECGRKFEEFKNKHVEKTNELSKKIEEMGAQGYGYGELYYDYIRPLETERYYEEAVIKGIELEKRNFYARCVDNKEFVDHLRESSSADFIDVIDYSGDDKTWRWDDEYNVRFHFDNSPDIEINTYLSDTCEEVVGIAQEKGAHLFNDLGMYSPEDIEESRKR